MKIPVYDLDGNKTENIDLPEFFSMPYRSKLIHRAVIAINSHQFSPQGRDPLAGERTSSESWNTGRGVSRIARVRGRGAGARSGQAAGVASVVKGRLPHPPRSEKVVKKKKAKKNSLRVRVFAFNLMKIKEEELNHKPNTFLATIDDPEPVISIDRDEVSLIFYFQILEIIYQVEFLQVINVYTEEVYT